MTTQTPAINQQEIDAMFVWLIESYREFFNISLSMDKFFYPKEIPLESNDLRKKSAILNNSLIGARNLMNDLDGRIEERMVPMLRFLSEHSTTLPLDDNNAFDSTLLDMLLDKETYDFPSIVQQR